MPVHTGLALYNEEIFKGLFMRTRNCEIIKNDS